MRKRAHTPQRNNRRKKIYLTKRILISAAKAAVKVASRETIQIMGYTVIANKDRIVRKYPDGRIEDMCAIEQANPVNGRIPLD